MKLASFNSRPSAQPLVTSLRLPAFVYLDFENKNVYFEGTEVDRFWWASWTSNPVTGRNVRGGFDSHALPPFFSFDWLLRPFWAPDFFPSGAV
jgi:hypothetical protein